MISNKSLISIIIPYFNKNLTINRAVNSVLAQTYHYWELIIIDDCGVEKLNAESLPKDNRISILYNDSNLGAAQTRQRGLNISNGEFIAFLDADDWWDKLFLEKCLKQLELEKECDGVYVKSLIHSKLVTSQRRYSNLGLFKIRETLIQYARPWQTGGIIWRKSSCGDWGNLKTNEDAWFEISSSKNNKLIPIDYFGYNVDRANENTLSNKYQNFETVINHQELYIFIYTEYFKALNIKYKIILFHRLVRGQLKIHEYCSDKNKLMFAKLLNLSKLFYLTLNNTILLKLIHKILQKSKFRINY